MTPTAHGQDDPDTTSAADHAEPPKTTAINTVRVGGILSDYYRSAA